MHEPTTETSPAGTRPGGGQRLYTPPHGGQGDAMRGAGAEPVAGRNGRTREPLTRTERLLITMFVAMFAAQIGAGAVAFAAISGQLVDMQQQMHEEIAGLRSEVREEIAGLRSEMRGEIAGLRSEMRGEIAEVREEIGKLTERVTRIETFLQIHHGPLPSP